MFVVSLVFASLIALWLGGGLTVITVGLFIPVVIVMLYVFVAHPASIIVKAVGGLIAFGGTLFWAWIVADSNNSERPGDLAVAALFFGILGMIASIIAGVFVVIVASSLHDAESDTE